MGKLVVSYERSVTFHIMFIPRRDLACNFSKSFLANRDNFCPYEQALTDMKLLLIKFYISNDSFKYYYCLLYMILYSTTVFSGKLAMTTGHQVMLC